MSFDAIKGCKFYKNTSPVPGGALLSNGSRLVTIHNSELCKNNSLGSEVELP